ncbi:MAG: class B sortase [Christensenellaceae bacterium]|jgi:sortase B
MATENEDKKNNAGKKKNWVFNIVIIAAAAVIAIALINIFVIKSEDSRNEKNYEALRQYAVTPPDTAEVAGGLTRVIDWNALLAVNPDINGWIIVSGTDVDYPTVKGEDNDFYMTHNANGEENRAGAIFLDMNCNADFSNQNTIIYGHRQNDGSMFGTLSNYREESVHNENGTVLIYTPDNKIHFYDIFATYTIEDNPETYQIGFADEESYETYLTRAKNRADFAKETAVPVSAESNIITLSTCVQGQDTQRYIVQAVLVETVDGPVIP